MRDCEETGVLHAAETTCQGFLDALASKSPVPGGGGASALAAALGTALVSMAGHYTLGKKKYADVEDDIKALMARAEDIRTRLLALVDEDAAAFAPLSRAYGIPRDDPARDRIMEQCLRNAAAPPMAILRLCCEAIDLHREMGEKGSAIMLSDVGTGIAFCLAALQGAVLNVRVNTKLMADRAYAQTMNEEADALAKKYSRLAEKIYANINTRYA